MLAIDWRTAAATAWGGVTSEGEGWIEPAGPWARDRYDSNGNLGAGLYEAVISADNGGNLPDLLTYVSNTSGQTVVDDLSDQISEAFGLGVGSITQTVTTPVNKIRAATDVDMFAFSVTAGQRIGFDIDNDFYSLPFNSYRRLFNSNGTELASNDNGAAPGESSGNESYLDYTFTAAGTYFIGASGSGNGAYNQTIGTGDGNGSMGGYALTLTPLATNVVMLQNNVPVANLSGVQDSQQLFKINVPAGQTKLEIKIFGGSGDADLYLKKGNAPTTSSYDFFLDQGGNDETITVNNPSEGEWYIMLRGYRAFGGVTLQVTFS